jgi:hypothetical protein
MAATVLLLARPATGASAGAGAREGWIASVAVGPGLTAFTPRGATSAAVPGQQARLGLAAELRAGRGMGDHLALFVTQKLSAFGGGGLQAGGTVVDALGSVGAAWYFLPSAPGSYVTAGAGIATWSPGSSGSSGPAGEEGGGGGSLSGLGWFAGGGYEFSRRWSLEGTASFASPSSSGEEGTPVMGTDSASFRLLLHRTFR